MLPRCALSMLLIRIPNSTFFLKWECGCCKRKPCMWVLGGSRGRQFKDLELSSGIERWGLWLLTPIRGEPVGS